METPAGWALSIPPGNPPGNHPRIRHVLKTLVSPGFEAISDPPTYIWKKRRKGVEGYD
jgi:hypothetical protein